MAKARKVPRALLREYWAIESGRGTGAWFAAPHEGLVDREERHEYTRDEAFGHPNMVADCRIVHVRVYAKAVAT